MQLNLSGPRSVSSASRRVARRLGRPRNDDGGSGACRDDRGTSRWRRPVAGGQGAAGNLGGSSAGRPEAVVWRVGERAGIGHRRRCGAGQAARPVERRGPGLRAEPRGRTAGRGCRRRHRGHGRPWRRQRRPWAARPDVAGVAGGVAGATGAGGSGIGGGSAGTTGAGGTGGSTSSACSGTPAGAYYLDSAAGSDSNDGSTPSDCLEADHQGQRRHLPARQQPVPEGRRQPGLPSRRAQHQRAAPIVIDQYGSGAKLILAAGTTDADTVYLLNQQYLESTIWRSLSRRPRVGDYRGISINGQNGVR